MSIDKSDSRGLHYDLGDGWEDPSVHSDPEDKRLDALKMGANIAIWTLSH